MSSYSVVQGDLSATLRPRPTVLGDAEVIDANWQCLMRVIDPTGSTVIDRAITEKTPDDLRFLVYLTQAETDALPVDTYTWVIELRNSTLSPAFNVELNNDLAVEPQYETGSPGTQIAIERGINSFESYENLLRMLSEMPNLCAASEVERSLLKSALVQAWDNIGDMTVDFENGLYSTRDFGVVELDELLEYQRRKLVRAQLIEADFILGGNPVEQRRRAGLMSDSTGEQAQFFRPTKPVVLPICRDAAFALSPYVRYSAGAGRG